MYGYASGCQDYCSGTDQIDDQPPWEGHLGDVQCGCVISSSHPLRIDDEALSIDADRGAGNQADHVLVRVGFQKVDTIWVDRLNVGDFVGEHPSECADLYRHPDRRVVQRGEQRG